MSLVNFITEHWCKSSLFRLNIKKFTVSHGRPKCTNSIPLRCISFSGRRPYAESQKKPLMCKHNVSSSAFPRTFDWYQK